MNAPRRSRSTLIVVLLIATLAMTAALAYEAQQSARSHRQTAENVLRDYARFAAWELARLGRTQVLNAVHQALGDVQAAMRRGHAHTAPDSSSSCGTCPAAYTPLTTFHRSGSGDFVFSGAPVDDTIRAVVAAAWTEGMKAPDDFTCPAMTVVLTGGTPWAVVWRPVSDRNDRPVGMFGFVADARFVVEPFERLLRTTPLLPPSLVPSGTHANAVVSVRVATPEGQPLFASSEEWSAYEAADQLERGLGGLQLAVALRPDAAAKLVIGGLPRERLPLVIGLLTLTGGLVVIALVQLRRETELSRMRSDFVSGVSHELRTPLAQIRMFTETLLLGRVRSASEGRRSLEIIARETQRLIQLVENVLLFSRGERRRPELARESASLAPIVADVVEGFAPLAEARQARIVLQLEHGIRASVDTGALRQILLNLLDNAVKYGPDGQTIRVHLRLDAGVARLVVEDEGPGVAEKAAERIWLPFNRLAGEGASGGAGIGLAIVRQLVELHGGRACVARAASGGASFTIDLPGASADAAAVSAVA
ncbi:MAG TPA: HAMP domain-containing sensor histidine kinase [Vicinamibacterales bacterium]|nr:HAMP domain-containing sensor histidine kinase [Vicinamibacterales bacterium]